jgi:hypothetical protein
VQGWMVAAVGIATEIELLDRGHPKQRSSASCDTTRGQFGCGELFLLLFGQPEFVHLYVLEKVRSRRVAAPGPDKVQPIL